MELLGHEFEMRCEREDPKNYFIQRWRSVKPIPYTKTDVIGNLLVDLVNKQKPIKIDNLYIEPILHGTRLMDSFIMEITFRIKR